MRDQPLDRGFAITHARLDRLSGIRVSVGLLVPPAAFGRGPRAHTVFCALVPVDRSNEYLGFLSRLGRLLVTPGAEEAFRSGDPARVGAFIQAFEEAEPCTWR
jgi:mannitol/fructose-specific phosphotransferase system IIA component (Ntr-type)